MNINEPRQGGGFVLPFFNDGKDARNPHSGRDSIKETPGLGGISIIISSATAPLRKCYRWLHTYTSLRNHFVATMGEFAGTTLFLLFAFSGTQVALLATPPGGGSNTVGTPSNPAQLLYVALCFGFSLAVNAWVFFRISGGLFNPAVTLGMCLVGALPYLRGLFLVIAQIVGGITSAAIVSCLFPGPITFNTTLGGGASIVQGLFIEMFLTAQLVFTIFMLAAEKHRGTFIAPIGIGLALFIAELTGVYFTGGSLNPARSFGPSLVTGTFPGYHWIYWVGPILGSIVASGFYKFMKMLEYESANPGQDAAGSSTHGVEFLSPEAQAIRNHANSLDDGMIARGLEESGAGRVNGTHRRPFSDSPAPGHPNDQFAGLNSGGIQVDDFAMGAEGQGTARNEKDSAGTLVENGKKSAMKSNPNGEKMRVVEESVSDGTYNN
ncbi:hypothetical protein DSL72_006351 [Monilinia vaccinii-corymbosi]|uniref:Aquaporin n=1 Tax=Monilinia vaccinii-corymbosi TaxID=61207 RepID=A0A8A3PLZ6_9HELO|nr:hypothetical protein DSL72_006351 [Monilinia vaccinii-corymbosi]